MPDPTADPALLHGYIESTYDALIVITGCVHGLLPMARRRLRDHDKTHVSSGAIFVFDEREAGIRRWTDGLVWSPSRILRNFLVYRQLDHRPHPHHLAPPALPPSALDPKREKALVGSLTSAYPFKPAGLVKKTFALNSIHLVSYFSLDDVIAGRLRTPSSMPELASLELPSEFLNPDLFRMPLRTTKDPQGFRRYLGEPDDSLDTSQQHQSQSHSPEEDYQSDNLQILRRPSRPSLSSTSLSPLSSSPRSSSNSSTSPAASISRRAHAAPYSISSSHQRRRDSSLPSPTNMPSSSPSSTYPLRHDAPLPPFPYAAMDAPPYLVDTIPQNITRAPHLQQNVPQITPQSLSDISSVPPPPSSNPSHSHFDIPFHENMSSHDQNMHYRRHMSATDPPPPPAPPPNNNTNNLYLQHSSSSSFDSRFPPLATSQSSSSINMNYGAPSSYSQSQLPHHSQLGPPPNTVVHPYGYSASSNSHPSGSSHLSI